MWAYMRNVHAGGNDCRLEKFFDRASQKYAKFIAVN